MAYPGPAKEVMPRATTADTLQIKSRLIRRRCINGALQLSWIDEPPGRLRPSAGQVLEIRESRGGTWQPLAWDDQGGVVVEGLGKKKGQGFQWQVTLSRPTAGKMLQLRVFPEIGRKLRGLEVDSLPGCPAGNGEGL